MSTNLKIVVGLLIWHHKRLLTLLFCTIPYMLSLSRPA